MLILLSQKFWLHKYMNHVTWIKIPFRCTGRILAFELQSLNSNHNGTLLTVLLARNFRLELWAAVIFENFLPLDIYLSPLFCIAAPSSIIAYIKRANTIISITQQNKEVQNIFKRQNENRCSHFSRFCRTTSPWCPIPIRQNDRRQYRTSKG